MNTNEEPANVTEQASADNTEIIDLDDVEGHGLREVAAGLGAAAVLAGGGAAALSATNTASIGSGEVRVDRATITQTVDKADAIRDGAIDTAFTVAGAASDLAGDTVTGAAATAGAVVDQARSEVGGTVTAAGSTVGHAQATASAAVDGARATVRDAAKSAGQTASAVKDGAVTTATTLANAAVKAAGDAVTDANRKVACALTLTQQVPTVAGSSTTNLLARVSAVSANAGAGVISGWVTITDGSRTLASAQVTSDGAMFTFDLTEVAGKTITATYSGDGVHASCANTIIP